MSSASALTEALRSPEVEPYDFEDDGTFPNNQRLPVLVYRSAVQPLDGSRANTLARLFRAHDWRGVWRNGIFAYHHYHSTAHEVLGVASGTVQVQLGGPDGAALDLEAGDVVVLPAGGAHKNLGADPDVLIVGAYPDGQDWDLKQGRLSERPEADRNIDQVPPPSLDPLHGPEGPLAEYWLLSS